MHHRLRRVIVVSFILALIAPALLPGAALAAEPQPYFNGFETDLNSWTDVDRVASETGGIPSADGSWHAEVGSPSPHTEWGGYTDESPARGDYFTRIDIYLDVDGNWENDTRFDWSVASNRPNGNHLRDFAFNAGFYNDAGGPGGGTERLVISASNNAGRANSYPKNPDRDPTVISTTGWYTFEHHFYDNGGALAVDLSVLDVSGALIGAWTLSNPDDAIGTVVGGNRYGWFVSNEFGTLAFDNSTLDFAPLAAETPPEVVTCLNTITGDLREVDDPSDCGRYESALVLDNSGADGAKIIACLNKYNHRMRMIEADVNCQPHESLVAWNQGTGDDPQIHACVNQYTGYFRIIENPDHCSPRYGYVLSWDNPGSPTQYPPRVLSR